MVQSSVVPALAKNARTGHPTFQNGKETMRERVWFQSGLGFLMSDKDKEAVSFSLPRPLVPEVQNSVALITKRLRAEFESAELLPTNIKIGKVGHGLFSVPVAGARIGITVWPEQSPSFWQVWILYRQSEASLRIDPPCDLAEKLERAQRTVATFLTAIEAQEIRWMSLQEAGERIAA